MWHANVHLVTCGLVEELLAKGALGLINSQDKGGYTPVHTLIKICSEGSWMDGPVLEVVRALVEAGANLALKDKEGKTPYLLACSQTY